MENMRFKVGDRVRIKSLDWYNENKGNADKTNSVWCEDGGAWFFYHMSQYCGKIMTIEHVWSLSYTLEGSDSRWTDEMIEGLVEEEVGLVDILSSRWVNEFNLPEGYIFKDENGNVINATKIVLEKKKKEYPKTFEECVHVLEGDSRMSLEQMNTFRRLIDARNAYWKIAGEEMGLDKPWKPDWNHLSDKWILFYIGNRVGFQVAQTRHSVFAFPTAEMRDAFYENFDKDLEICKELL